MNRDDVIPPSPEVRLNKSRGRVKNSDTSRQKKKRRPLMSLRAKSRQEQQRYEIIATDDANADAVANTNTEAENAASVSQPVCDVNIYDGLDDLSAEENSNTRSILRNFDILSQPKLIEQCNQSDMRRPQQITASQPFVHGHGLVSLKELMQSSQEVHLTGSELSSTAQTLSFSSVGNIANENSLENLQFSEWPFGSLNVCAPNDKPHCTQKKFKTNDESTESHGQGKLGSSIDEGNISSATNASTSIVQSILGDFDDDEHLNREAVAQTPPVVLNRRRKRKTYSRTRVAAIKTLIFDEANVDQSFGARTSEGGEDGSDIECTQGAQDVDLDLNTSHFIVENITRLSTFLTQPQSLELDFNTNLSQHSVTLNEEFREFAPESDDSERINISTDFEQIDICTPNASQSRQRDSTSVRLLDEADDALFVDITTPKVENRFKSAIKDQKISPPLSSSKGCFDESSMHSTPSTSKATLPLEHRVPKRLQFGIETDLNASKECPAFQPLTSKLQGFVNARGNTIEMSSNQMKRANDIFFNIDSKYKQIDPSLERMPCAKKRKITNMGMSNKNLNSRPSPIEENNRSTKVVGFQMASGSKPTTVNAKNFFGEDFTDLTHGQRFALNADESEVSRPNAVKIGFATARGTNLTVSAEHVQRFAQTYKAVEREVEKEYKDIVEESEFNDSVEACRTPLRNQSHLPNMAIDFKSTTAAPSFMCMGFATARGSNIEVTSTNMEKYGQTLKKVEKDLRREFNVEISADLNEAIVVCKTPMNKLNHRANVFATSTPNPNAMSAFKNCPPITPISYQPAIEHTEVDHLNDAELCDRLFEMSTQQFVSETKSRNNITANPNDTMTNDFQLLNDSITEKEEDFLRIPEEIKREREIMLSKQQAESFKKQHKIQPQIGWLHVQKVLNSKKLHELGPPKKFAKSNELEKLGVQRNVIEVCVENALNFKFDMWKFYGEEMCRTNVDGICMQDEMRLIMDKNGRVGVKELTSAFLACPSVDPKLVPDHWTQNCLKWVIVKLASYERSYPSEYAGRSLTPENVLAQVKYRYGREIDAVMRSAIRKIVEQDDTAAKRMVLFVSRILGDRFACSLELCDGWYSIRTGGLDAVLSNAVFSGKIAVGTKLVIQGAEIIGFEEACSPLEMPSSVALKISANSTRRARWHAKLGYCEQSWPFALSLNSVCANGGLVTRMKAFVLRVYPVIYVVKQESDSGQKTVFRSRKVELRQNAKDENAHFDICQKLYFEASEQIEKEYESERKKKKRTKSKKKVCDIEDGEELWNYMESSNDSIDEEAWRELSTTQQKLLEDYTMKQNDQKQNRINAIVREKLQEITAPTKSTPLQKVRLIDATAPKATKTILLSIWNADDDGSVRENTTVDIRYATANGMRGRDVQLTAGRMTIIREVPSCSNASQDAFKRRLTPLAEIDNSFKPHFNEFDTIGFVFKIDEVSPSQLVYITDAQMNIFCVKFVGGIQQFAYEDIVKVNKCLVISHLDWRPQNRFSLDGVPQAFVTEITTFSESPKLQERATALSDLREKLDHMDLDEFIEACCEKLTQIAQTNKENTSANTSKIFDMSMNQTVFNQSAPLKSVQLQSPAISVLQRVERLKGSGSPPVFRRSYLSKQPKSTGLRRPFKPSSIVESDRKPSKCSE